jgi:dynactin complex subunit
MSDEDLKSVISAYQQKSFELFNQNIVLETQVNQLTKKVDILNSELSKLKSKKNATKSEDDY